MKKIFSIFSKHSLVIKSLTCLLFLSGSAFVMILTAFNSNPQNQEGLGLWQIPVQLEKQFFDWRYRNHLKKKKRTVSPHAILAAIDEKSLMKIGRFPWSRRVWVDIIHKLGSFGAKIIAFDVIFSEEEISCNDNPDQAFAQALSSFPAGTENIIISYAKTHLPSLATPEFPPTLYHTLLESRQKDDQTHPPSFVKRSTFPISQFTEREVGLGFIDMQDDQDGVFRHYSALANIISPEEKNETGLSQLFPSLGLLSYIRYADDPVSVQIEKNAQSTLIKTQKGELELDDHAATRLRYRGIKNSFTQISLSNIIESPLTDPQMTKLISNKAVFIASTAFAAHDFRNSPVQSKMPGVLFHMNFLDMLSEGRFFKAREKSLSLSLALLALSSLFLLIVQRFKIAPVNFLTAFVLMGASFALDALYFLPAGLEIKLLSCLFSIFILYLSNAAIHFYQVSKEKKAIRGTFSHYLSPSIVNEMLSHPSKLKMGGEKKDITVFFSDVRDFTSISEKLQPHQIAYCLNQYMNEMTSILFSHKGTLDKYIGDAIVAYWGAPIVFRNHPTLAVKAALEMIEILPKINKNFESQGYPLFQVGIGINTGECSVGNMGSDQVFSYTALGDHMNLGARLEGLCKFYGAQIIISESTFNRLETSLKQKILFRHLDLVRVKGRTQSVHIYEILASYHLLHRRPEDINIYRKAWHCLQQKQFSTAIELSKNFLLRYPHDKACQHLLAKSQVYIQNPPGSDWDGATIMDSK